MQNIIFVILTSIAILSTFGTVNTAFAHTGINDAVETTSRQDYVYSNINAPCSETGWNATSATSTLGDDVDGDGICDGWERPTGLLIDFIAPASVGAGAGHRFTYSYVCGAGVGEDPQCPSPDKKDVYLELNWMKDPNNSHVPAAGVVQAVKDAYAAAPVINPNGQPGIRLHVQFGEWPASPTASHQGDVKWHKDSLTTNWSATNTTSLLGFYRMKSYTFGTVCERFADTICPADTGTSLHKNTNYRSDLVRDPLTAKFQAFHYAMIINKRVEQPTSSGWAEIWGNDHVWSLGGFTPAMGNVEQQKGTFMHELGHNFKLNHGGIDTIDKKPNYLSVMNFPFQFIYPDGKDLCRPLEYSNQQLLSLSETNLIENAGVNNAAGTGYLYPSAPWSCSKTWTGNAAGASLAPQTTPVNVAGTQRFFWYSTPGSTSLNAFDRTNQAVNWNNDVPPDDSDTVTNQDINAEGGNMQTLVSYNDWTGLVFDFGNSPWAKNIESDDELRSTINDYDSTPDPLLENSNCEDFHTLAPEEKTIVRDLFTTGCEEITTEIIDEFRTDAVDEFNQILSEEFKPSVESSETSSGLTTPIAGDDLETTIKKLLKLDEDIKQDNVHFTDKERVLGAFYNTFEGFGQAYVTGTKVKSGVCKDGFEQIVSFRDGKIACVKQGNAKILEDLGWGFQLEKLP